MKMAEKKKKAQDLIMHQLSIIGYGESFEAYCKETGEDAEAILKSQMDRVAKLFGFNEAWFS